MTQTKPHRPLTIGVFDSGFGGLTVLRALLPLIPGARFLYLGDTARLPYGSKSRETVVRYAISSARFLLDHGADILVIACNTATALALPDLQAAAAPIPVIGVIEPGAQAAQATATHPTDPPLLSFPSPGSPTCALAWWGGSPGSPTCAPARWRESEAEKSASPASKLLATPNRGAPHLASEMWVDPAASPPPHVLVLATDATVQSRAYTQALEALHLQATEKACPLLVPLVEEGWLPSLPGEPTPQTAVTAQVLRIYLTEAQALAPDATTLLLGCTHYPLLEPLIRQTLLDLHYPLTLIDSADATARATAALVREHFPNRTSTDPTSTTFYATDSTEKFQRLGSRFLGQPLPAVHLIDLGG